MSNRRSFLYGIVAACGLSLIGQQIAVAATPSELDRLISQENAGRKIQVAPLLDDLGFLRRVTVDVIGRIPTEAEIKQYLAWPADQRRGKIIDELLKSDRFADRWTVFLADMLRIRSNVEGGALLMAFVHKAVETGMPYDELCRRLISANGKPGRTPEVGFILGDNADPMALAGTTAQVFLGIRVACAQCHDHPFDVWKRKQFYGFAAYFGKTRRIESQLTGAVYTTETNQTTVLWPPEDAADGQKRLPMKPSFPFASISEDETPDYIFRLLVLRAAQAKARTSGNSGNSLDDLLASADDKVRDAASGAKLPSILDVDNDVKRERQKINLLADMYKASLLRHKLAEMVTSPRNRYFAKCLTNRVWSEVLGRGFVEPLDDFSEENAPSHPKTLDYLADEFVAGGYDLRNLLKLIFTSHAYQRARLTDVNEPLRLESEAAFAAGRARRMLAESLFDSIVQAGHLFEFKYPAGANKKTVRRLTRVAIPLDPKLVKIEPEPKQTVAKLAMKKQMTPVPDAYDLESAVAIDFDALLKANADEPMLEKMRIMSKEEIEAMRMMIERRTQGPRMRYVDRYVDFEIDDNPRFSSAMRMASPAPAAHFLRIFGQPARADLGDFRSEMASMRQALMMLNGKLTHEASRVGDFEPVFPLLSGKKADLNAAIKLVYREILTREPSSDELSEAKAILASGDNTRAGMADLRWVLFNCHEFRFVP